MSAAVAHLIVRMDNIGSNEKTAAMVLAFLASGGTLEGVVNELPNYKPQVDAILSWMKANANCSDKDIEKDAERLRDLVRRKEQAIKACDFELAADLRDQECKVCKPYGLKRRHSRGIWGSIQESTSERQIQVLADLFSAQQSENLK